MCLCVSVPSECIQYRDYIMESVFMKYGYLYHLSIQTFSRLGHPPCTHNTSIQYTHSRAVCVLHVCVWCVCVEGGVWLCGGLCLVHVES